MNYIIASNIYGFSTSCNLANVYSLLSLIITILKGIMWTLSAVLVNIFVIFKDVGHLIMCLLGISSLHLKNVSSLMGCS